jgi:hypothetical protein
MARKGRGLGGKQEESRGEESKLELQPEEKGETREDELEQHGDETRREGHLPTPFWNLNPH